MIIADELEQKRLLFLYARLGTAARIITIRIIIIERRITIFVS